ncbi:MAG: PKD domain-containing protein [Candidatus Lokiarchaeota archaeon]|nr:PKD domain-containing protein [Candidatus Lokiarchaeota archaeon]
MNKKKITLAIITLSIISIFSSQNLIMALSNSLIPSISSFSSNRSSADVNEEIEFTANLQFPGGPVNYYVYNFHDGSEPVATINGSITHSFPYEGFYLVTVTGVGSGGITTESTLEVCIVNEQPHTEMVLPDNALEDEIVYLETTNFVDTPNDVENLRFQWLFGDGNYLEGSSVNWTWRTAGEYPVSLIVFDDQNALDMVTEFIEIINVIPEANFTISNYSINEDESIIFNASSSSDSDSDRLTLQYYWDFGDGAVGRERVVEHVYRKSGEYNVTLIVVDDNGAKDENTQTIQVNNLPPQIDLTEEDVYLPEGQAQIFDTTSNDTLSDFQVLNYTWSFGNQGWRTAYAWKDDWQGEECVTVQDPEGESASDSMNVTIINVPPKISVYGAYVEANLTLTAWGTPNNTLFLYLFENGELLNFTAVVSDLLPVDSFMMPIELDLSKDYQIIVNISVSEDSSSCWFNLATLKLTFLDGSCWSSRELFFDTPYSCHEDDPKEWILDPKDYLFKWPITFKGIATDPGADVLEIDASFNIHVLLDINTFFWCLFPEYYSFSYEIDDNTSLNVELYRSGSDISVEIDIIQDVLKLIHNDTNSWPAQVEYSALVRPVDLSFLSILDTCIFSNPLLDVNVIEAVNVINVSVKDDDGANDNTTVYIYTDSGELNIENLSPRIEINVEKVSEQILTNFTAQIYDPDGDQVNLTWNMGDGTILSGSSVLYSYPVAGNYLIQVEATDGVMTTVKSKVITVINKIPEVDIIGIFNASEDESKPYISYVQDSSQDMQELRYSWDFGDGLRENGNSTTHAWARNGLYELCIKVMDDNGAIGEDRIQINIYDLAPVIEGSYGFQVSEGTVMVLDVQAHDSTVDEPYLEYYWQVNGFNLTGKKPTIWSDDANYMANLTVIDMNGFVGNFANITAYFINTPPTVFASSFINYGLPQNISFKAYAVDSFVDIPDLTYNWTLDGIPIPDGSGLHSNITWNADTTGMYMGSVKVTDDCDISSSTKFQVAVTMDADGDGITDEEEAILGLSENDTDTDDDWITDWYELYVYFTDPWNNDTDGDGLADGFDVLLGAGELTLGTDPTCNDTDYDNLTDGFEIFGWNIQDPHNESNMILVQSNPLNLDSDGDGLTDWEEWYYWIQLEIPLDPKDPDTDGNGILDDEQVDLGIKYDSDGDGLTDAQELGEYTWIPKNIIYLASGTWANQDFIVDSISHTRTNDLNGWTGSKYFKENEVKYPDDYASEPLVEFQGQIDDLYSIRNDIYINFQLTAGYSIQKGYFKAWNYQDNDWETLGEYDKTNIKKVKISTDESNYAELIQNGTFKFKIEAGFFLDYDWIIFVPCFTNFYSNIKLNYVAAQTYEMGFQNISDPFKADTDDDGLNDWEEFYPGTDGFRTNPRNNDTDSDGLLDSAETYTTVKELENKQKIDANAWRSFTIGSTTGFTAVNASTTVSISVGEEGSAVNLNVRVKLGDTILYTNTSHNTRYYCNITEVSKQVNTLVGSYSGTWKVEVYCNRDCMLEEFKVEITQRLNPGVKDFDGDGIFDGAELDGSANGWITNPARKDSDGDGWSDSYEIYSRGTNPNSLDTDGDSVYDAQDVDPLRNLIIKVIVKACYSWGTLNFYQLQAVTINVNDQVVVTTYEPQQPVGYTGLSGFGHQYYFDVPDQQNTVEIIGTSWRFIGYPNIAEKIVSDVPYDYSLDYVGHFENVTLGYGYSWLTYDVETLGLTHVNTIAVYQEGSFQGNHYPTIERMNAIILDVTHVDNNYPLFKEGINVIVMPTSLFVNSKLHALIEQAVDKSGAVNMNKIPACLQGANFSSMDRNAKSVSKNVECLITKESVSPAQAWAILQLCLISANQTEGQIYEYAVVEASRLGLASDVLALIPFDGSIMQNSGQALMLPKTVAEAWEQFWGYVGELLLGLLVAILLALLFPFILLVLVGIWIIGAFGPVVMAAIEAVVKAIIILFALIILVIQLIFLLVNHIILIGVFSVIATLGNYLFDYGFFYYRLYNEEEYFLYGISIEWIYVNFIDLSLPYFTKRQIYNDFILRTTKNPVLMGASYNEVSETSTPELQPQNNQETTEESLKSNIGSGFGLALGIISAASTIFFVLKNHELSKRTGQAALAIAIIALVATIFIAVVEWFKNPSPNVFFLFLGIFLAMIMCGSIISLAMIFPKFAFISSPAEIAGASVGVAFDTVDLFLTFLGFGLTLDEGEDPNLEIILNGLFLTAIILFIIAIGISAITMEADSENRGLFLMCGAGLIIIGIIGLYILLLIAIYLGISALACTPLYLFAYLFHSF